MKKIIFPFLNKERHSFLKKHWWYRLLIILYIVFLLAIPFYFYSTESRDDLNCLTHVEKFYGNKVYLGDEAAGKAVDECIAYQASQSQSAAIYAIIMTIVAHYAIQLIFYKVVIDFIYKGKNKL